MNVDAINQVYLFLIFIINGILIGIIFDIFRILRRSFKTSNLVTSLEDVLFWIISALLIMYSIFKFNNGQFRLYIFIGIFLGIAIYMLFFSKYIIKISVKIIAIFKKILSFLFKIFYYPINKIYTVIKLLLIRPILFFIKQIKNTFPKLKILRKSSKNSEILNNKEGFWIIM